MAAEYRLVVRNTSGTKVADVVNFLWLAYAKQVGKAGLLRFGLPSNHALIGVLADNYQVEAWRRNPALGVDWYNDFGGLYKDNAQEDKELPTYMAACPGQLEILNWRMVAWPAETANRSKFTNAPAETISKTLVNYNLTANATIANGRVDDGTTSGMTVTVQADGGGGNSLDWACCGDNLLDTLYKLSLVGGGDYDLVKTGVTTWDFRWYAGQRGVDRTATVIFATERGNMVEPSYALQVMQEKTVAIVGGQGQGSGRRWLYRHSANYAATHKTEALVDGRSLSTDAALQAAGDAALKKTQMYAKYGFKVKQAPSCAYGKHYCVGGVLGDLVTARFYGISATQKIDGVTVAFDPSQDEVIDVSMRNV